jgi:2-methylcitrate dehydratase PrpD
MEQHMADNITIKFVRNVRDTPFEVIQPEAIQRAKIAILDIIAVSLAAFASEISTKVRATVGTWGGRPDSRIFFTHERLPAHDAALVNATMSRVLDFDDTFELAPNGAHASAYIVPTALAIVDRDASLSGKDLLAAVALATDLYCRTSRSIRANAVDTGRDNGSAVFGTAAVAMRLMHLDERECLNAFGIAYAQAAGEFQMYEEASQTVSLQQGLRARSGIDSAELAKAGFDAPKEALYGRYGFFRAFEPVHDQDLLIGKLGVDFIGRDLSYKPYPCCKCIHPAISATLKLRKDNKVEADKIKSIRVGTNRLCNDFLAKPEQLKWDPPTMVAAKFSMPFGVSVAAAKGEVGIAAFEGPALHDREVRRLLAATTVEIDDDIERTDGPNQNAPAKVYFKMANGTEISHRVDHPLGHPRNPPSMDDVVGKLRQCANYSALEFSDTRLNSLCEMVAQLDTLVSARNLVDLMCVR